MSTIMSYATMNSFETGREEEGGPMRAQVGSSGGYARYHPYHHPQHYAAEQANSVSSTSPRSPLQCDKCGAVYEDANQLAEHTRSVHPTSPGVNSYQTQQQSQPPPQYQQLAAGSPQHHSQQQQVTQSQQQSQAQTQQQQMHASSPQGQPNQLQQHPQQSAYEFPGGPVIKTEIKNDPEEQAEILDLDSHKVQTHRYEDEYSMRLHHQEMQHHMQMQQHQAMQHHQPRSPVHSVNSMLSRPPVTQPHDYHPGMSPMGPMDSVTSMQDQQNQFMLGQLPLAGVEPPRHPGSPIITSTQPMPGHPMTGGLMQQNPKPPPLSGNQSWKSNEARRPKTYNCTACNKWFTSSGHLKRHYNTTLHKNAVKQSNQPDPATMPISAHHHPARDNNRGGGGASRNSPELSSSSSPPNLMAGPSGEATRGLLHTPTPTSTTNTSNNTASNIFNNNNNISNSSNSNEALAVSATLEQKVLQQQQHHQHQHQSQQQQHHHHPSTVMLASSLMYLDTPPMPGLGQVQQQHQQQHLQHPQMGSPSPQLGQQQQQHPQQHHHLAMGSASPHHHMTSPMSPMQQHPGHMSSPTMGSGHHHMNSPSPTMGAMVQSAVSSPPPGAMMGGTTMPHQPYPNALPPHVTTITSIPGLLESITSPLTTTGNSDVHANHQQQQQQQEMQLPGFGTFTSSHDQKPLPSFTQFGYLVGQSPSQAVNVGGLSPEEDHMSPHEKSYDSPVSNYENYENYHQNSSPPRYEYLSGMEMMQTSDRSGISSSYSNMQQHHHQQQQQQQNQDVSSQQQQHHQQQPREANNNLLHPPMKGDLNPNIVTKKPRVKQEKVKKQQQVLTKEHQVTSTNTGSHYISENGLHKCIECDKVFNKACYLTQHNKSFHSGDKPFKCNQCGKRFPQEYLHAEHLQKHAGDKPYKCEICPKQFNHKTDLRRHMCLHTGEKPYACDNCGKGFIRKDHMMKHLETHKKKNNLHKIHLRA